MTLSKEEQSSKRQNMGRRIGRGLAIALLWLVAGVGARAETGPKAGAAGELRWPLDLKARFLTSNFMEFRDGRFHAGLDLKTQSRPGFPVHAAEDGWISRLRATPTAYGRAIYLRGASGRTYVYAHLERFNDTLAARVADERRRTGRYSVRQYFRDGEVPVRRGQVLGLSGQSGTNGPHLHFEVRDDGQRPLNPLACGFAVPDTIAPTIRLVRALPASPDARIAGQCTARTIGSPSDALTGRQPPLTVQGPVAFSAVIVDRSDIRAHRLEPWLIEVRLDGDLVYRCRNERFGFTDNSQQRLEWLVLSASAGRPALREHWLHRRSPVTLPGREGTLWYIGPDGAGLPIGRHEVEITAADFAGNVARCRFALQVLDRVATSETGTGTAGAAPRTWSVAPAELSVAATAGGDRLTPFFADLPDAALAGACRHLDPAAGDPVLEPATLLVRPVHLDAVQRQAAAAQGLTVAGPVAEYLAADWPIDAAVLVDLPGTAAGDASTSLSAAAGADTVCSALLDPTVGVYLWHRDSWRLAESPVAPVAAGSPWRFPLTDPGRYAVFCDRRPPVCTLATGDRRVLRRAPSEVPGITLPRWQTVPIRIDDFGSGVAFETVAFYLGDRPLIVEPDPPRDRILVTPPDGQTAGEVTVRLEVQDKAGNPVTWAGTLVFEDEGGK